MIKGERERLQNLLESNKKRFDLIMEPIDNLAQNTACDTSSITLKLGGEGKIALSNVLEYVHRLNEHVADLVKLNEYSALLKILADQGQRRFEEFIRKLNRERIMLFMARRNLETRREENKIKQKDKMKERRIRDLRLAKRKKARMMKAMSKYNTSTPSGKIRVPFQEEYGEVEEEYNENDENEEDEMNDAVVNPDDSSSDDNLEEEQNYEKIYDAELRSCNRNFEMSTDSELNLLHDDLNVAAKAAMMPSIRARVGGRTKLSGILNEREKRDAIRKNPFPKTQEDFKREILEKPLNIRMQTAFRNIEPE